MKLFNRRKISWQYALDKNQEAWVELIKYTNLEGGFLSIPFLIVYKVKDEFMVVPFPRSRFITPFTFSI